MITVPQEIKDILHKDSSYKNYRIHFPNGERTDICNDLIVKGSVSFKESLCSQDTLRFGLCESPTFECELVGVGNIIGSTIEVFCEVECPPSYSEIAIFQQDIQKYVYQIPMGTFEVKSAQRQADMQHRKIVAYNYMMTNFDKTDPYIDFKSKVGFSSSTVYSPDVLSTALNNCGATTMLGNAEYTPISIPEQTSNRIIDSIVFGGGLSFNLRVRVRYGIDHDISYPWDALYYQRQDPLSMTQFDAFDKCIQDIASDEDIMSLVSESQFAQMVDKFRETLEGFHYEQKWTIFNTNYPSRPDFSKSNYLYPYQISPPTSGGQEMMQIEIITGISVLFTRQSPYDTKSHSCDFVDPSSVELYKVDISRYPAFRLTVPRDVKSGNQYVFDKTKVDYYDMIKALIEMSGLFWVTTRDGGVRLVNIKQQFGLTPDNSLFPSNNLYPEGVTGGKLLPKDYQSCWYDDDYTKPFGAVRCAYTNTNKEKVEFTLYLTGFDSETNPYTYQVYELKDNYIINNYSWTEGQIQTICETIASNISGVRYMPVQLVGRGLPYVEAGDTFEVLTRSNDSITTIVLHRTLTGEQTLTDTYKSV